MIRLLLSVFLLTGFTTLYAGTADTEANCSVSARGTDAKSAEKSKKSVMNGIRKAAIEREVNLLIEKLGSLEEKTSSNNIWSKVYSNYHTYQQLKARQEKLLAKIFKLKSLREPTRKDKENLERYISELHTNEGKLQLLDEFRDDPFKKLVEPPKIGEIPRIGNPLEIISALSFMKKINEKQKNYQASFESLKTTIRQLEEEASITEKLMALQPGNEKLKKRYIDLKKEIETIRPVMEIYDTTKEVFDKKIEEIKLGINRQIAREVEKAGTIGGVLLFFFILFLAVKYLLQKYMSTKESFYTINKISNILFFTILIFTVLFAYIDNVNYLVTIMGFASAGIAIAMKDLFMSLMGWFAIIIGGSIHVGDRVKFVRDGVQYVGDIVDISLLRMTMQEDITLTTYMHNRRAGRIIFIPNNYIFTDMIANYSHSGLKTVWDGIDFMITFDSNISKATFIAKEVTKKYSRGYTDITRKQLNKLRSSYHLKNTNVEPRIFSFIEDYGIRISAWYLTNAFATLTLRSTISSEIIEKIQAESDIEIAYPTQSLYMDRRRESTPRLPVDDSGEGTEEMPS
jgi:small-conductance mechanosensitive channel